MRRDIDCADRPRGTRIVRHAAERAQVRVIPTVLANTKADFDARLARLLPVADELQVDFMDGHFVPSVGIALDSIPDLARYPRKTFEAHLMVEDPENWIDGLIAKGFKRFIIHYEAVPEMDLLLIIDRIHKDGKQVLLALNPETDVHRILPYTRQVDGVLFLGVHPGFNGAPYVTNTPSRIAEFIALNKNAIPVQVDGGMTPDTVAAVVAAGATAINSGSFVSNAADPAAAIAMLRKAAAIKRPAATRSDSSRPDSSRPDSSRPDSSRPDYSRPDKTRLDSKRSRTKQAVVKKTTVSKNQAIFKRTVNVPNAKARTSKGTAVARTAKARNHTVRPRTAKRKISDTRRAVIRTRTRRR